MRMIEKIESASPGRRKAWPDDEDESTQAQLAEVRKAYQEGKFPPEKTVAFIYRKLVGDFKHQVKYATFREWIKR